MIKYVKMITKITEMHNRYYQNRHNFTWDWKVIALDTVYRRSNMWSLPQKIPQQKLMHEYVTPTVSSHWNNLPRIRINSSSSKIWKSNISVSFWKMCCNCMRSDGPHARTWRCTVWDSPCTLLKSCAPKTNLSPQPVEVTRLVLTSVSRIGGMDHLQQRVLLLTLRWATTEEMNPPSWSSLWSPDPFKMMGVLAPWQQYH